MALWMQQTGLFMCQNNRHYTINRNTCGMLCIPFASALHHIMRLLKIMYACSEIYLCVFGFKFRVCFVEMTLTFHGFTCGLMSLNQLATAFDCICFILGEQHCCLFCRQNANEDETTVSRSKTCVQISWNQMSHIFKCTWALLSIISKSVS